MREFSEAWFGLSFSVQKATYIITLGKGHSFAECRGWVPNYLVVFREIKRLARIIVKHTWSSMWREDHIILKEQCIPLVSFPSCVFVVMPSSTTSWMRNSKCLQMSGISHLNLDVTTCSLPCSVQPHFIVHFIYERKGGRDVLSCGCGNPVYYHPYPLVLRQCWKSPDALHLLCTLAFLVMFIKHNVKLSWCQLFLRICSYRFFVLLTVCIILGHCATQLDDPAVRNSYHCSTQPLVHPVT